MQYVIITGCVWGGVGGCGQHTHAHTPTGTVSDTHLQLRGGHADPLLPCNGMEIKWQRQSGSFLIQHFFGELIRAHTHTQMLRIPLTSPIHSKHPTTDWSLTCIFGGVQVLLPAAVNTDLIPRNTAAAASR